MIFERIKEKNFLTIASAVSLNDSASLNHARNFKFFFGCIVESRMRAGNETNKKGMSKLGMDFYND